MLADAGYDVWLINNRGNGDSMTAVHPPATDDFWNFGHDEIGLYDTPAAIDYILDETNQTDLTYVCHSQGCTMYYIMCLEKPKYEVKINKLIGLAPFFGMKYPASVFNIGPFINLASTVLLTRNYKKHNLILANFRLVSDLLISEQPSNMHYGDFV